VKRVPVVLLFFVAGGCTTTIIPPAKPADPAVVFVTNYGRHSSLLLPASNDQWTEYAFGDWDWFALGHKSSSSGIRALFFSKESALGRREIKLPDPPVSDVEIARVLDAKQVESLRVSRERSDALRHELDEQHQARIDTATFNPEAQLWFVKSDERYGLCYNCNHATAQWLRELGCTIKGSAMFSRFRVKDSQE
jgi:hypothetical protein